MSIYPPRIVTLGQLIRLKKSQEYNLSISGFSLVELLVAMAVSALLMVSLLSIVSKSMDVSKRANTGIIAKGSAQAALDLIVTDLDSLAVNRNAGEVFRFTNFAVLGTGAGFSNPATIYCLTTSPEDSYSTNNSGNSGVPRLVQYVIQYTNNYASSSNCFGLYRNVLDPTNTFGSVIASGNQLDTSWNANAANVSNYPLVPNAVGMNVAIYSNYGSSNWVTSGVTNNSISTTNFPRGIVLEISLTVLDEPGFSRLGNGSGTGNNSPSALINQYGRTLVRRVLLPSPL